MQENSARRVFAVSEVVLDLRRIVEENFSALFVSGELSNVKFHSSGHLYFTVKDDKAQLAAVMWRAQVSALLFRPEDGMKVVMAGKLSVYPPQGKVQFYAERLEPDGVGALQLAFEQLKKKLAAEGLFDDARKRPIPFLPRKVGIITSETGAVIYDLLQNLRRRYPKIDVVFAPARVQGEGAAADVTEKLAWMNGRPDVDVVIIGRGGGSLEDLWAFNDEGLARAIAVSRIPVISAVGHESDFTISDFVADLRASTPTAAAELAVPVFDDLLCDLDARVQGLLFAWRQFAKGHRERIFYARGRLGDPRMAFLRLAERLLRFREQCVARVERDLVRRQERLARAAQTLSALSPLSVLKRGYAIAVKAGKSIPLKSSQDAAAGEPLEIILSEGRIRVEVVTQA